MIMVSINQNIIEAFKTNNYDAMVHGCNCFCNMGAGVAKEIAKNYKSALIADQATKYGDKTKLGTYSSAQTTNGTIINAYTQYRYGGGRKNVDLEAIKKVFEQINKDFAGKVICIPKIGAGLAGGNWKEIKKLINGVTPDVDIDVFYI